MCTGRTSKWLRNETFAAKKEMQKFMSAPLPFVGQKRMFASEYSKLLKKMEGATTFVDLFGGSGLLSHITKRERPEATVVYNDFDGYRTRLEHIPETNRILSRLREITQEVPYHKHLSPELKEEILKLLKAEEERCGFVDYITLSSSLLFSAKYVLGWEALSRETLYNNVRKCDYEAQGYLDGIEVASCDYKVLFERYKDQKDVVFLVDPPYLCTDTKTYRMSWSMADYLDVLTVLKGSRFVYFTSNKSSIIELCEWLGRNKYLGNPFEQATKKEINARLNYNSNYTDIMLYNVG
jgi:site-specific DNA-adenine methylase